MGTMGILRSYRSWGNDFYGLWNDCVMNAEERLAVGEGGEVLPYSIDKRCLPGVVDRRMVVKHAVWQLTLLVFVDEESKGRHDVMVEARDNRLRGGVKGS